MDKLIVYVSKARLVKLVGLLYQDILQDLLSSEIIDSFEEVVAIKFDKDKALHIQSVLEFYDVRETPSTPLKTLTKKED